MPHAPLDSQDHFASSLPEPSPSPLFRPEVRLARRRRAYGSVVVVHPLSHTVLTVVFALLASSVILFIALFGFHRKFTVEGVVTPDLGLLPIRSPQAGTVTARLVRQDQLIEAGTPMFRISAERASTRLGDTAAAVLALLAARRASLDSDSRHLSQQAFERRHAKLARLAMLKDDGLRIGEERALEQRRIELADQDVARYETMQQQGFVSNSALQDKEAALLDQRLRLAELAGSDASNQEQSAVLAAEVGNDATQLLRDLDANARAVAEIDSDIAQSEAGRELVIEAPQAGTVSTLAAEVGEEVSTSQILAALVPTHSHLEALLYAPSQAAGFIQPGMDVLLRYESFPFQKFGLARGHVTEVAQAAIETAGSAPTGTPGNDPVYRIRVRLERQDVQVEDGVLPLKAGMRLEASVVLEERKLYQWVLEPLTLLQGRL